MSESRESTARNLGESMREATPEASLQHHLEGRARLIASVERMRAPWAADAETLDVWMQSGTASVAGPVVGEGLALAAGQHVTARVHEGSVQIDAAPAPADSAPAPSTTASATQDDAPHPTHPGHRGRFLTLGAVV
jgi:hypothetical protein